LFSQIREDRYDDVFGILHRPDSDGNFSAVESGQMSFLMYGFRVSFDSMLQSSHTADRLILPGKYVQLFYFGYKGVFRKKIAEHLHRILIFVENQFRAVSEIVQLRLNCREGGSRNQE
jgi:hypothetical protein